MIFGTFSRFFFITAEYDWKIYINIINNLKRDWLSIFIFDMSFKWYFDNALGVDVMDLKSVITVNA